MEPISDKSSPPAEIRVLDSHTHPLAGETGPPSKAGLMGQPESGEEWRAKSLWAAAWRPVALLGWKWLASWGIMVLVGIMFWILKPSFPPWVGRIDPRIPPENWWVIAAILPLTMGLSGPVVAAWLGAVNYIVDIPSRSDKRRRGANIRSATLMGYVETVLYPASLVVGIPEFIGLWLVIKTAGEWGFWQRDRDHGRRRFGRTLIGNATSVLIGVLVYGIIKAFAFVPT